MYLKIKYLLLILIITHSNFCLCKETLVAIDNEDKTQYHEANFNTSAYNFGYDVGPGGQFHHETRGPDGVTYGCYGFVDERGSLQATHYIADAHGYRVILPKKSVEIFPIKSLQNDSNPPKLTLWKDLFLPKGCGMFENGFSPSSVNISKNANRITPKSLPDPNPPRNGVPQVPRQHPNSVNGNFDASFQITANKNSNNKGSGILQNLLPKPLSGEIGGNFGFGGQGQFGLGGGGENSNSAAPLAFNIGSHTSTSFQTGHGSFEHNRTGGVHHNNHEAGYHHSHQSNFQHSHHTTTQKPPMVATQHPNTMEAPNTQKPDHSWNYQRSHQGSHNYGQGNQGGQGGQGGQGNQGGQGSQGNPGNPGNQGNPNQNQGSGGGFSHSHSGSGSYNHGHGHGHGQGQGQVQGQGQGHHGQGHVQGQGQTNGSWNSGHGGGFEGSGSWQIGNNQNPSGQGQGDPNSGCQHTHPTQPPTPEYTTQRQQTTRPSTTSRTEVVTSSYRPETTPPQKPVTTTFPTIHGGVQPPTGKPSEPSSGNYQKYPAPYFFVPYPYPYPFPCPCSNPNNQVNQLQGPIFLGSLAFTPYFFNPNCGEKQGSS